LTKFKVGDIIKVVKGDNKGDLAIVTGFIHYPDIIKSRYVKDPEYLGHIIHFELNQE